MVGLAAVVLFCFICAPRQSTVGALVVLALLFRGIAATLKKFLHVM